MALRPNAENSRYRLEDLRARAVPTKGPQTWQQYRAHFRDQMPSPLRSEPPTLSTLRAALPRSSLGSGRNQSPLQKYRSNPDLFYQNLGSPRRTSSPSTYSSYLSTGLLRSRNELNVSGTTAILKRRLNDVLKLEDLRRAQEIASEMTPEDVARLPSGYVEGLAQTLDLILRKVRNP